MIVLQFNINNKKGASLLEIVATITITSIALLMIYNILFYNIHQNGVNQEKMMNANIANGALSYIIHQDFTLIDNHLHASVENYGLIDENSCNTLFSDDVQKCMAILSPVVNNKEYHSNNLYIYIIPYNDPIALEELKQSPPPQAPEIFINYLESIDTSQYDITKINHNAISIIVIVESSINPRYDFLLEGVTTK